MSLIATTIIPALLPAAGDAIRGIIAKFTGSAGAAPQNVDEAIKLMDAEVKRMEALAKLDAPAGAMSKWVADLRASARYIAVYMVILTWIGAILSGADADTVALTTQLAQAAFFFLFGDRVYLHLKKRA